MSSFEFFPEERPLAIESDADALLPGDIDVPAFRGMGHEAWAAPARGMVRLGEAAGLALAAGVDVELPTGEAYLAPLAEAVRSGAVDEALVDRAVRRALRQKEELGLLDETFEGEPPPALAFQ